MWDSIDLGSAPGEEHCAQFGQPGYQERALKEIAQLKRMMEKMHPPLSPTLTAYCVGSSAYQDGTLWSLCASFQEGWPEAEEWAWQADKLVPARWDREALAALSSASKES